jgi:hypothetical protein
MASYMDYAATRGQKVGGMLGQAVDAFRGVEDAEAAVERVLKEADWSTEQGKADMLAKVGAIDPEAHGELQKQLLEAEQTREATSNIKMDTENKLIGHKLKLNKGIYAKEWERQGGAGGMEFNIQYFLDRYDIPYEPTKVRTVAAAKSAITKHLGDKNDNNTLKDLDTYLGQQMEMFVTMRATQDASKELGYEVPKNTEAQAFDTPREGGTTETDTGTTDTEFNPKTADRNVSHRAENNGVMGTWKWEDAEWVGGMDGYQKQAGWKHYPDGGAGYTGEEAILFDGKTSDEMFDNFLNL